MPKPTVPMRRRGRIAKPPGAGKPHSKRKGSLTAAQEVFIVAYAARHNATRAYLDAFPGASYATAHSEGSKLYRDPRISPQIRKLLEDQKARLRREEDRVLEELAGLAFSCITDVFDGQGKLIEPQKLARDVALAVKEVERQEILGSADEQTGTRRVLGHTIKLKMHDKVGPLKVLGQHFGVFAEAPPPASLGKDFAAILEAAAQRVTEALPGRLIEGQRIK